MTFEVSSDPFTSDPDNNYLVSLDDFKLLYARPGLPDFVTASDGLDHRQRRPDAGGGNPARPLSGGQPAERHRQRCPPTSPR